MITEKTVMIFMVVIAFAIVCVLPPALMYATRDPLGVEVNKKQCRGGAVQLLIEVKSTEEKQWYKTEPAIPCKVKQ